METEKFDEGRGQDKRNESIIAKIASKRGLRLEDVRPLYERILSKMEQEAVIRDFIAVLAARKVESLLDDKVHSHDGPKYGETG